MAQLNCLSVLTRGVPLSLIEGLTIPESPDGKRYNSEESDRPKMSEDIRRAVGLEKDTADDAQEVGERENFAEVLRPFGHAAERKHEARKQEGREEKEERHLQRLKLV